MNQLGISIPIISAIGSFLLIFCLRTLDVFEREPLKYIILNFLFGIIAYLLSAYITSVIFEATDVNNSIINLGKKTIYIAVIFSSLIMLFSQIICGILSSNVFKKQYDTLTDYLIYFSSIGIGFSFSEIFFYDLLNKTSNSALLKISKNLYFSSFFSGTTLPFLMAGFGAGIFLLRTSKLNISKAIFNISIFTILFSFLVQLIFYSMNYFILVAIPSNHTPSNFLNIIKEIKFFANNLSQLILISSVGFAVLFDSFIVNKFAIEIQNNQILEKNKCKNLIYFINPFSYIFSDKIKKILKINPDSDFSKEQFRSFANLALKNFKDKENSSIYINEAKEIINR